MYIQFHIVTPNLAGDSNELARLRQENSKLQAELTSVKEKIRAEERAKIEQELVQAREEGRNSAIGMLKEMKSLLQQ